MLQHSKFEENSIAVNDSGIWGGEIRDEGMWLLGGYFGGELLLFRKLWQKKNPDELYSQKYYIYCNAMLVTKPI